MGGLECISVHGRLWPRAGVLGGCGLADMPREFVRSEDLEYGDPPEDLECGDVRAVSAEGVDNSWIPEPPKVETPAASSPKNSSFLSAADAWRAEEETAVAAFWGEEYNNRFTEDFPLEFAQSQYRPRIFVILTFLLGATCPRPQPPSSLLYSRYRS